MNVFITLINIRSKISPLNKQNYTRLHIFLGRGGVKGGGRTLKVRDRKRGLLHGFQSWIVAITFPLPLRLPYSGP